MLPWTKSMKSNSITQLFEAGFVFVALNRNGYASRKDRNGATHKLEETENSIVAVPLRKWKHKSKNNGYGALPLLYEPRTKP